MSVNYKLLTKQALDKSVSVGTRARSVPAGSSPTELLEHLLEVERLSRLATAACVHWARESGATWQDVADVLGVTRQGAQQRFGALLVDRRML